MAQKTAQDMVVANAAIWSHYLHAIGKHPHFADVICKPNSLTDWRTDAAVLKAKIQEFETRGEDVTAHSVLMAELYEVFAAYCAGDIAQARYEVLDAIAVLLRIDDMLAKMQETQNG